MATFSQQYKVGLDNDFTVGKGVGHPASQPTVTPKITPKVAPKQQVVNAPKVQPAKETKPIFEAINKMITSNSTNFSVGKGVTATPEMPKIKTPSVSVENNVSDYATKFSLFNLGTTTIKKSLDTFESWKDTDNPYKKVYRDIMVSAINPVFEVASELVRTPIKVAKEVGIQSNITNSLLSKLDTTIQNINNYNNDVLGKVDTFDGVSSQELSTMLAQGAGSVISYMATGLLGGALGGANVAKTMATLQSAGSGFIETMDKLEDSSLSYLQKVGVAVPTGYVYGLIEQKLGIGEKIFESPLIKKGANSLMGNLFKIATTSFQEGAEEVLQSNLTKTVEDVFTDHIVSYFNKEDAWSFAVGAILGGGMQGGIDIIDNKNQKDFSNKLEDALIKSGYGREQSKILSEKIVDNLSNKQAKLSETLQDISEGSKKVMELSKEVIDNEKIKKEVIDKNKEFFGDTDVNFLDKIVENKNAVGQYSEGMIDIVEGRANAKDTYYHESVHKYIDVFTSDNEKEALFKAGIDLYGTNDRNIIEERLAEDFISYANNRSSFTGKMKAWFDRIFKRFTGYLSNKDRIDQFYSQIVTGKAKSMKGTEGNQATKFREIDLEKHIDNRFLRDVPYSEDMVARERFNIPELQKLSFGGSDRDVYDLGKYVLKIAKTARGLAQNQYEGEPYAPVPQEIERGANYVVVEKAEKPNQKTKDLVNALKRNVVYANRNSELNAQESISKTAKEYYDKGDEETGMFLEDFNNYSIMLGDITAIRNWGTIDGEPVLVDAGTLSGRIIDDYNTKGTLKRKPDLEDEDFRKIYYQSKEAKKKYGDKDDKTKYREIDDISDDDIKKYATPLKNKALVISADEYQKNLAGYDPKNPELVHRAGSDIAQRVFEEAVKNPKFTVVEFIAGGAGSGKSESYVNENVEGRENVIILDGTLQNKLKAERNMLRANLNKKDVEIVFILTDISDAWNFNQARERTLGKESFVRTHANARNNVYEFSKEGVKIKIINNVKDQKAKKLEFNNKKDEIAFLKNELYNASAINNLINGYSKRENIQGDEARNNLYGDGITNDERAKGLLGDREKTGRKKSPKFREDLTNTDNFKRWFGDSKVVDENGKPLVVYHGSPAIFDTFDASKTGGGHDVQGAGFYFTDSEAEANQYTDGTQRRTSNIKEVGKIYPVYLKIENPVSLTKKASRSTIVKLVLKSLGFKSEEEMFESFDNDIDLYYNSTLSNWSEYPKDGYRQFISSVMQGKSAHDMFQTVWYEAFNADNKAYLDAVSSLGYDGVIIPNEELHGGNTTHYIVFKSNNIKSVDNNGDFSLYNDNIKYRELDDIDEGSDVWKELEREWQENELKKIKDEFELEQNYDKELLKNRFAQYLNRLTKYFPPNKREDIFESSDYKSVIDKLKAVKEKNEFFGNEDSIEAFDYLKKLDEYMPDAGIETDQLENLFTEIAVRARELKNNTYKGAVKVEKRKNVNKIIKEKKEKPVKEKKEKIKSEPKKINRPKIYPERELTPLEPFKQEYYEEARKVRRANKPKNVKKDFRDFIIRLSSRLSNINPEFKALLREYDYTSISSIIVDSRYLEPFFLASQKLSKEDKSDLDFAMLNSDLETINGISEKNNLPIQNVRRVLNDIYARAKEMNFNIQYKWDYYPRTVTDPAGLLAYLYKTEMWTQIEEAIKQRSNKLGYVLSLEEQAQVANNMLRGFRSGNIFLSNPKNTLERTIEFVTPEMMKFYGSSFDALANYVTAMNEAIAQRQFFGKYFAQSEYFDDDFLPELGQYDTKSTFGAILVDLLAKGKITPEQETELHDLLLARFGRMGNVSGWVAGFRNLSYITTMNSIFNSLTQIGDVGLVLWNAGLYRGTKSYAKALLGFSETDINSIVGDNVLIEFSDNNKLGKFLKTQFKAIGLDKLDKTAKIALVDSTIELFRYRARKDDKKLFEEIGQIIGYRNEERINAVIQALKYDETTPDIKLLAFNKVADLQPITLSEMPKKYLTSGNGKIFYMLKSYSLTMIDTYRQVLFSKMKTANGKTGFIQLMKLLAYLILMGASADSLKELLKGNKINFSDRVIDNIIKSSQFFNRYIFETSKTEGLITSVVKQILPPFGLYDDIGKDLSNKYDEWVNKKEAKKSYTVRNIPFSVGKLYYYWFGRGKDSSLKKEAETLKKSLARSRIKKVKVKKRKVPKR